MGKQAEQLSVGDPGFVFIFSYPGGGLYTRKLAVKREKFPWVATVLGGGFSSEIYQTYLRLKLRNL